jgi:hypothetical protein
MDFGSISGNGYLLIGGLILIGGGLLLISLFVNRRVAISVRAEERHREKLYEYYRNTFSQLGVILIGIGVSLFIFFFQQGYQERQRHAAEVRQLLAKLSVRAGRAAPVATTIAVFDPVIRYTDVDYVVHTGPELADQVRVLLRAERDVDLDALQALAISDDLATSPLAGDIDPVLWFAIAEDEAEVFYYAEQLQAHFDDLRAALGDLSPDEAVADPDRAKAIGLEVRDILYDMDVVRDRGRRLIGKGCRFVSAGQNFLKLTAIPELEANYNGHDAWIEQAEKHLAGLSAGRQSCFDMLRFAPDGRPP